MWLQVKETPVEWAQQQELVSLPDKKWKAGSSTGFLVSWCHQRPKAQGQPHLQHHTYCSSSEGGDRQEDKRVAIFLREETSSPPGISGPPTPPLLPAAILLDSPSLSHWWQSVYGHMLIPSSVTSQKMEIRETDWHPSGGISAHPLTLTSGNLSQMPDKASSIHRDDWAVVGVRGCWVTAKHSHTHHRLSFHKV